MPFPMPFTAGQVLTADGLNNLVPLTILKTVTEALPSSTTMQNDNEFFFTALANATYKAELDCFISGPNGANVGEILMQWTVPVGTVTDHGIMTQDWAVASGAISSVNLQAAHSTGSPTSSVLLGTSVFTCYARMVAVFRVAGTGGAINLQWAQSVSSATASNMLEGSTMTYRRIS